MKKKIVVTGIIALFLLCSIGSFAVVGTQINNEANKKINNNSNSYISIITPTDGETIRFPITLQVSASEDIDSVDYHIRYNDRWYGSIEWTSNERDTFDFTFTKSILNEYGPSFEDESTVEFSASGYKVTEHEFGTSRDVVAESSIITVTFEKTSSKQVTNQLYARILDIFSNAFPMLRLLLQKL